MSHHIIPPPELVQQWAYQRKYLSDQVVFSEIAQWGADQELEACCEWLEDVICDDPQDTPDELRAARRPKPPSLKEQAIAELDDAVMRGDCITVSDALPTIRRALEQLPDNE